jgi:hypothetical protein
LEEKMTFRELSEAVKEMIPGETFSVQVSFWDYAGEVVSVSNRVDWTIWRPKVSAHFQGTSPEVALARLKANIVDTTQNLDVQLSQADPS